MAGRQYRAGPGRLRTPPATFLREPRAWGLGGWHGSASSHLARRCWRCLLIFTHAGGLRCLASNENQDEVAVKAVYRCRAAREPEVPNLNADLYKAVRVAASWPPAASAFNCGPIWSMPRALLARSVHGLILWHQGTPNADIRAKHPPVQRLQLRSGHRFCYSSYTIVYKSWNGYSSAKG